MMPDYFDPEPAALTTPERNSLFEECIRHVNTVLASLGFIKIDDINKYISNLDSSHASDFPVFIHLDYHVGHSNKLVGADKNNSDIIVPSTTLGLRCLDLMETKDRGKRPYSWWTFAVVVDSHGDTHKDFPIVLAAIKPYIPTGIGDNKHETYEIQICEDDERVIEIKHILGIK